MWDNDKRLETFSLEEADYSILAKIDLFITNMQLFNSQDVHWWTGVVWIIVMFLSAIWTHLGRPEGD